MILIINSKLFLNLVAAGLGKKIAERHMLFGRLIQFAIALVSRNSQSY